jgi:hypothetical protein
MGSSTNIDRQRHKTKLDWINVKKMALTEGLEEEEITEAFLVKQSAGIPKNGKEYKEIQQWIARKKVHPIREAVKHETHVPTRAMLIRNLALIEYRYPSKQR